jgi:PleD family two-component response regulator
MNASERPGLSAERDTNARRQRTSVTGLAVGALTWDLGPLLFGNTGLSLQLVSCLAGEAGSAPRRMNSNESATAEIVCLLDDDQAVLKSVGRLLASDGFQVRQFSEPTKLLDYLQTRPVPLVVLDVWMEQMSGLEVQAKLAKVAPQTRVIIMTGREDSGLEQTARKCGAIAFFIKPFDDEKFLDAVRSCLSARLRP